MFMNSLNAETDDRAVKNILIMLFRFVTDCTITLVSGKMIKCLDNFCGLFVLVGSEERYVVG